VTRQSDSTQKIDMSFDTLSILQALVLNHEDSMYIHPPRPKADFDNELIEQLDRQTISNRLGSFDFHFALSTYKVSMMGHYGSYVILYKETNGGLLKRIRQDSIDIMLGNRSMFNQQIRYVDINHDGYKDLAISFTENTSGCSGYNLFWVFRPSDMRFEFDSALSAIFYDQEIYFDESAEQIISGGGTANAYSQDEYRWNGHEYELSLRKEKENGDTVETVKRFVNGEWQDISSDADSISER